MPELWVYVTGALVGGGAVGLAVALVLAKRMSKPAAAPEVAFEPIAEDPVTFVPPAPRAPARPPAPTQRNAHPERAPAMVLTTGVDMQDAAFERSAPRRGARPAPPQPRAIPVLPRDPPPPAPVPSEWARRQVGPVESGRTKGVCSGCGTSISVSDARPLRIACPVCGRTKLLA